MDLRRSLLSFTATFVAVLVGLAYFDAFFYDGIRAFRPWYYDMIEHFLGGIVVAALFVYFIRFVLGRVPPGNFLSYIALVLGFVLVIAVVWEVYEYVVNVFANMLQDPAIDTLSDIGLGLFGAFCSAVFIRKRFLKNI